MATYSSIIEHDRIIASTRMMPIGARPQIDPSLENAETAPADAPTYPDEIPVTGWVIEDISPFTTSDEKNISDYDTEPIAMIFGDNGNKLYIVGNDNGAIIEFDLTSSYDITTSTYVAQTAPISGITSISIDPSGTKLYVGRNISGVGSIYQYELDTEWDITTLTLVNRFSFKGSIEGITSLFVSENGSHLIISGQYKISHFKLREPWDLDSYIFVDEITISEPTQPLSSILLTPDGTKMYVSQGINSVMYQYSLSTQYYVSTASFESLYNDFEDDTIIYGMAAYDDNELFVLGWDTSNIFKLVLIPPWTGDITMFQYIDRWDINANDFVGGSNSMLVRAKYDGTKMYMSNEGHDALLEFDMTTPWDITTLTHVNTTSTAVWNNGYTLAIEFNEDGTKCFSSSSNAVIRCYSLSTPWDTTTLTYDESIDLSPLITNGTTSGTARIQLCCAGTVFMIGNWTSVDEIHIFNLSTANDLSTATYVDSVTVPTNCYSGTWYMTLDGTRIFIAVGNQNDRMYTLEVPYDLTSTWTLEDYIHNIGINTSECRLYEDSRKMYRHKYNSGNWIEEWEFGIGVSKVNDWSVRSIEYYSVFDQSLKTTPEAGYDPWDVYITIDGTHLYTTDRILGEVNQWDLSIGFDLDSATFVSRTSLGSTDLRCVRLNSTGTLLFALDTTNDKIETFQLSSPWNTSSATNISLELDYSGEIGTSYGFEISNDGTKVWVSDYDTSDLLEYELYSAWDLSTATYSGNSLDISVYSNPSSISINIAGDEMLITHDSGDIITRWTLSTPHDITTATYADDYYDDVAHSTMYPGYHYIFIYSTSAYTVQRLEPAGP